MRPTAHLPRLQFLGLLLLVGCTPPRPPEQLRSEHFRIHADQPIECEGFSRWLEHHYAVHAKWLGIPPEDMSVIEIYEYKDLDALRDECDSDHERLSGCHKDGKVFGLLYDPHELAHAYSNQIGNPPLLFEEGLAQLLQGGRRASGDPIAPSRELVQLMPGGALEGVDSDNEYYSAYDTASSFMRFLTDRHGRERYLEFYRSTPHGAGLGTIRARFREAFSEELDRAIDAWLTAPAYTFAGVTLSLAECETPPFVLGAEQIATPSCAELSFPASPLNASVVRSLTVPERGPMRFRLRSVDRVSIHLAGCGFETAALKPANLSSPSYLSTPGRPHELWTELDPGKYWMQIGTQEAKANGPLHLTALSEPGLFDGPPTVHELPEDIGNVYVARDAAACRSSSGACEHSISFRLRRKKNTALSVEIYRGTFYDHGKPYFACPGMPTWVSVCEEHEGELSACVERSPKCVPKSEDPDLEARIEAGKQYRVSWRIQAGQETIFTLAFEGGQSWPDAR
jgi:hypothetical protein